MLQHLADISGTEHKLVLDGDDSRVEVVADSGHAHRLPIIRVNHDVPKASLSVRLVGRKLLLDLGKRRDLIMLRPEFLCHATVGFLNAPAPADFPNSHKKDDKDQSRIESSAHVLGKNEWDKEGDAQRDSDEWCEEYVQEDILANAIGIFLGDNDVLEAPGVPVIESSNSVCLIRFKVSREAV